MTITDDAGREITLPAVPQRIVSLSPSNTEILFAVGAGPAVVGVTCYCDFPVEAQELPEIGGYSSDSISIETIVSMKPDLVLADSASHATTIEALEQANIPVFAVDATSFEDVFSNIGMIGKVTGNDVQAAALIDEMETCIAAVTDKVGAVPQEDRPSVFWEVWDEPLMTVGPRAFTAQLIQIAGGTNIFSDLTEDYPQVSAEEVIRRNPAFSSARIRMVIN